MNKRKLLIGLLVAGLLSAGFGTAIFPASADQRTYVITLATGQTVTVTEDVPSGTPVTDVQPPPHIVTPVVGVQQVPTSTAPSSPGVSVDTSKDSGSSSDNNKSDQPVGNSQTREPITGAKHHKLQAQVEAESLGDVSVLDHHKIKRDRELRKPDGAPTAANPTFSFALPGPAPIGVPNFFIEKFRIPPFLLPIYQAAGIQYGVRWETLAAINEIETDYGRNLAVSSAGALGWMQFIPSSWKTYGVDANGDGKKDPFNPVDAIFAAARYLRAAGGGKNINQAIFAYNHADWYVQSVLLRAKLIGGMPADLVGSLTGLTQGHFPVAATATYADALNSKKATSQVQSGNAAVADSPTSGRRSIDIFSRAGAPVIAVNDGMIRAVGSDDKRGRYIVLQDVFGNIYTYSHLGKISATYPAAKQQQPTVPVKSDVATPP